MFLEDLNTANNSGAVSPLNHDYDGRFSRKGSKKIKKAPSKWWTTLIIILFTTILPATDLILFAGSGNIKVFEKSVLPIPEVVMGFGCFFAIMTVISLLLHKSVELKSAFAGLVAFAFIYAVFRQFSQIQQTIELGATSIQTSIIAGIVIGVMVFVVFVQDKLVYKILLLMSSVIMFSQVYMTYMRSMEPHEFVESFNNQKPDNSKRKLYIHFMFPNLVSYPYFSSLMTAEATRTKNIITGFYQKNKFKIYSNAYTPENEYLNNMIISFNPLSDKYSYEQIMDTKLLSEYWRFHNLRDEYIYLKNNQLYDIFRKNKFQISAYKSRDFDMCHAKHKINVNRCIEKINQPTNIYSMSLSTWAKTKVLFVEWFASLHLLNNMSSLYNTLAAFVNVDKAPMVGVNYNNLYVVNSTKTLDILYDDIKKDSGKQAYFVFVDIPSNMYIYDEYCRLKTQDEWYDMANLPWISTNYDKQRKLAYFQQTKCLYGKLQQFIDRLKADQLWNDTVMVIQGTSGVNNFQNFKQEKFDDNFLSNRLVNMAFHDKQMVEYQVNDSFCPTQSILAEYLFNRPCKPSNLGVHNSLVANVRSQINRLNVGINEDQINKFEKWYSDWKDYNQEAITSENFDIYKKENHDAIYTIEDAEPEDETADNIQINQNIESEENVKIEKAPQEQTIPSVEETIPQKSTMPEVSQEVAAPTASENDFGIEDL